MPRVSFKIEEVLHLVEFLKQAKECRPKFEQTLEEQYYKEGTKPTPEDYPENSEDIDKTKIPKSFWLVKDEGVYLMPNGIKKESNTFGHSKPVYAKGLNPSIDDDWYDEAHYKLGGDDFSIFIPLDWFTILVTQKPNARMFAINIGETSISLAM